MKKIIILCISIVLLLIIAKEFTYIYSGFGSEVQINSSIFPNNETSLARGCSFILDKEEEITLEYDINTKVGMLEICLNNSDGDSEIIKITPNGKGEEKIKLQQGKYVLRVDSEYFKGTFHVFIKK